MCSYNLCTIFNCSIHVWNRTWNFSHFHCLQLVQVLFLSKWIFIIRRSVIVFLFRSNFLMKLSIAIPSSWNTTHIMYNVFLFHFVMTALNNFFFHSTPLVLCASLFEPDFITLKNMYIYFYYVIQQKGRKNRLPNAVKLASKENGKWNNCNGTTVQPFFLFAGRMYEYFQSIWTMHATSTFNFIVTVRFATEFAVHFGNNHN